MKNLKDFYPCLREKSELLEEIHSTPDLLSQFDSLSPKQQKRFVSISCGEERLPVLYDFMFKEIFNPEYHVDNLNALLSAILGVKIRVKAFLPNDSTRLADENTLLITDIVVELENGDLVNIEIQRIGYYFPGQRAACYSADMLLRQYKRAKDRIEQYNHSNNTSYKFSYNDIQDVYTIIFIEKSPKEFHLLNDVFVHKAKAAFDSGLSLNLLQNYIFVPLDIFKNHLHNKRNCDYTNLSELEAWLTFLSEDNVDNIAAFLSFHPQFTPIYEIGYRLWNNIGRVMNMFSDELKILDNNTVQLMIDNMQDTIKEQYKIIDSHAITISKQKSTIDGQNLTISKQKSTIDGQNLTISEQKSTIEQQKQLIAEMRAQLDALKKDKDI